MRKINTRKATLDDVPDIVKLILALPYYPDTETDVLVVSGEPDLIKTVITNRVTSKEILLYVAEINNTIVGVGSLNKETGYIGQLYFKAKDEEVLAHLLEKIENEAKTENVDCLLIKITKNSTLLKIYTTSLGYIPLPTTETIATGNYYTKDLTVKLTPDYVTTLQPFNVKFQYSNQRELSQL